MSAPGLDHQEAARLGDLKTEGWTALREKRHADYLAAAAELKYACEAFRLRHFPKAREVFVVCDRMIGQPLSVFRRTPSGRVVLVHEEPRP